MKSGSNEIQKDMSLSYPMSTFHGQKVFVAGNLFGVKTSENIFSNQSTIIRVETIVLWYSAQTDTNEKRALLRNVTTDLFEMSKLRSATKLVNFSIFGDEIANREMIRGAFEATKLMVFGFFLLLGFVCFVVWHKVQLRQLPYIVFAAVLSPFLAATVSFGILSWLRVPIYSIMCVTPFLILGIGVDDAFIMLQSWTNLRQIVPRSERLANVFIEIGPSISITSITNMIAFAIGYLTPTPQMSLFCLSTSVACFLDFVFTFTLFAPVLYLSERDNNGYLSAKICAKTLHDGDRLLMNYTKLICSWKGRSITFILLILLYTSSAIGTMRMKSTFEPAKAFPSDSPLACSLGSVRNVFDEFFPLQIIVNKPPNISNPQEYRDYYEMIRTLEMVPRSYGVNSTVHFLEVYEEFDRKIHELLSFFGFLDPVYRPSYDNLPAFLNQIQNPPAIKMRQDESGKQKLVAFQLTAAGQNMSEWSNRAIFVEACRRVVDKFPQLNATVYDGDSAILDLILTAKKDLIGSIAVTVLCMAIICLFFIRSKIGVLIVTFVISSICFTLVGSLSWWGADMDPVTMVDVLIATGFSVDYTAHIAYKFYRLDGTKMERVRKSLNEMCAPMIQAGLSTVLCMAPLMFVPTYAIIAFSKTVFIVVGLGLLHGIFILPVFLVLFSSNTEKSRHITCDLNLIQ